MATEHRSTEELSREECVRLLAQHEVGRVGFVAGGRPEVLPVNYVMDGDGVVFRTAEGLKLGATSGAPVTFEVDHLDRGRRSGWSVVVHGVAHEVESLGRGELARRLAQVELDPWGGGDKPFLVRIAPIAVTGRRVGPHADLPFAMPMFGYDDGSELD